MELILFYCTAGRVVQLDSCTVGQLDSCTVGQLYSWTVVQLCLFIKMKQHLVHCSLFVNVTRHKLPETNLPQYFIFWSNNCGSVK